MKQLKNILGLVLLLGVFVPTFQANCKYELPVPELDKDASLEDCYDYFEQAVGHLDIEVSTRMLMRLAQHSLASDRLLQNILLVTFPDSKTTLKMCTNSETRYIKPVHVYFEPSRRGILFAACKHHGYASHVFISILVNVLALPDAPRRYGLQLLIKNPGLTYSQSCKVLEMIENRVEEGIV